jgi:hypothetical protein
LAEENNCKIAIIYDSWFFSYGIPADWIKVGQWTIQNNVVCGSDTISFYAVDPLEESTLITHLQDFSNQLPNDVIESGLYTE